MQIVFIKCSYEIISLPGFFKKLKEYVGEFRIEQQSIQEAYQGVVTISFYTDKVQIEEGKIRQVELIATYRTITLKPEDKLVQEWDFTEIKACY